MSSTLESIGSFVPAPGRSVVYQYPGGKFRPAQIVRVWDDRIDGPKTVNLVVFLDGANDRDIEPIPGGTTEFKQIAWKTSVTIGFDAGQYLPRVPEGYGVGL